MISAALKMINRHGEVGDFAADIAEIITKGGRSGTAYNIEFVGKMGEAVIRMVDNAVLAFTNSDLELAQKVCKSDDEVDDLFNGAKTPCSSASARTNSSPNAPSTSCSSPSISSG